MTQTQLESRIAFIHDLAQRGGFGATPAAGDAVIIIELALRELLRRHVGALPPEQQRGVEQAIATAAARSSRAKGLGDLTLGQLVGVIRERAFSTSGPPPPASRWRPCGLSISTPSCAYATKGWHTSKVWSKVWAGSPKPGTPRSVLPVLPA